MPPHPHRDLEAVVWFADRSHQASPDLVPVLVVSPSAAGRRALEEILRPPSFRVLLAGSAAEAARLLRETAVPVVVAESDSQDSCWKELRNAVRTLHQRPEPRLIVMGSRADDCLRDEPGAFEAIAKPFVRDDLLWAVTDAWMDWRRELEGEGRSIARAVPSARR